MNTQPSPLSASKKNTLASLVYAQLRTDILNGKLAPNTKLRLDDLCECYAAGNSPVREALNRLSADRLVVREDQRGFFVAPVSRQDLEELTKTRCWLEDIAIRESIAHASIEWEEKLVLSLHRLSRISRVASDYDHATNPEWDRLHRDFHLSLISTCGSHWMLSFCALLHDQAERYRRLAVLTSAIDRDVHAEHSAIVAAALAGDADLASKSLLAHYRRTAEILSLGE